MSSLASLSAAQFSVSPMLFASVIPTGAPRGFVPSGNLWRGVEGSRRSVLCPKASRSSPQTRSRSTLTLTRSTYDLLLAKPGVSPRITVTGTMHGKNSPWQNGQGWFLGIPPLRATDCSWQQDPRGAPVGMTALNGFVKNDVITRTKVFLS